MDIDVISICKDEIINAMKKTLNVTDKFDEYILEQLSKHNDYEFPSKTLIDRLLDNELSEEQSKVLTPIVEHQIEMLHNADGDKKDFMPLKRSLTIVTNTEYAPEKFSQEIHDSEPEENFDEVWKYEMAKHQISLWSITNGFPRETRDIMAEPDKKKPFMISKKWKKNELYNTTHLLEYGPFLQCQMFNIHVKTDDIDVVLPYRTFCNEDNFKSVKRYIKEQNEKGVDVISVEI